ncbi:MAG: S-layer homology domain-containing protein, partial [Ruminiclostridium sp.]|nr:S-layer homology domain-containing protein [Ruminiclostridium sp.]
INGRTNGDFDPAGNVTRAEAAKMICIALNGGKEPVLSASANATFADINGHWAAKYIEYCVSLGIVAGKSATSFDPNGNVTGVELAKMLLIALGYNAQHEKFVGGNWDTNVNVVASQKALYEGLETIDPAVALSRDNAAQMIWNALQANEVEYKYTLISDGNGGLTSQVVVEDKLVGTPSSTITLMEDKYGIIDTDETTEILNAISYNTKTGKYTYNDTYVTTADYTDLLGQNVCFVIKATDDVLGAYAEDSSTVAAGVWGDAYDADDAVIEADGEEFDVANITPVAFGASKSGNVITLSLTQGTPADYEEFVAIDNTDDDDEVDMIIYYPVDFDEVTYVGSDYARIDTTPYDFEDYDVYEGVAKEDMALISVDATLKTLGIITEMEKQTGTVESTSSDGTITIDGVAYTDASGEGLENDDEIDFYAINDYVVIAEPASTAADLSEFAVVTKYASNAGTMTGPQAKLLFTTGGDATVVDLDKEYSSEIEGKLVTFEIEDGEYVLTVVDADTEVDFDEVGGTQIEVSVDFEEADKGKSNATIGTAKINSDAVVFVFDGVDEYSVITGAELAKINDGETTVIYYGADENSNNYPFVSFAYVESDEVVTTDTAYGYVVSTVKTAGTGDDAVMTFTMWNGEEEVPVATEAGYVKAGVGKGSIIAYTMNTAGEIDNIEIMTEDVAATGRVAAIASFDGEDSMVIDWGDGNQKSFVIDEDDSTVLFIDKTNTRGETTGSIQAAVTADATNTNLTEGTDYTEGTNLYYNVLVVGPWGGGDLVLLVVDTDNDWNDVIGTSSEVAE